MKISDIIDKPSPNYFIASDKIEAIVLHGTAGSLISALNWLTSPASVVSANYVISKLGAIYRLVPYWQHKRAWANGVVNNPDNSIKWLNNAIVRNINPNLLTISIEHEASEKDMVNGAVMPPAQLKASIWLTQNLLKGCSLQPGRETILGHYQFDSVNRPHCPGVIHIPAYIKLASNLF